MRSGGPLPSALARIVPPLASTIKMSSSLSSGGFRNVFRDASWPSRPVADVSASKTRLHQVKLPALVQDAPQNVTQTMCGNGARAVDDEFDHDVGPLFIEADGK